MSLLCTNHCGLSGIFCSHISQSLEEARIAQEAACSRREEEMQGIVMEGGRGGGARALLWAGFGPLLGTLAVLVGFVLWPTENVFLHPDHWFECMLQCGVVAMGKWPHNLHHTVTIEVFFWQGFIALFLLANTAAWLGAPRLLNRPAYLASFLTGFTIMTGYWLLLYLVWTPLLGLPYPPPLLGVQAASAGIAAVVGAIWFQFPPSWRTDAAFRKKVKFLLLAQMFILVMSLQYWVQLQIRA